LIVTLFLVTFLGANLFYFSCLFNYSLRFYVELCTSTDSWHYVSSRKNPNFTLDAYSSVLFVAVHSGVSSMNNW